MSQGEGQGVYRYGEREPDHDPSQHSHNVGGVDGAANEEKQKDQVRKKKVLYKIERAARSFTELFDSLGIPGALLQEADAIILVNSFKMGLFASFSYGTGILIVNARRASNCFLFCF